jgi:thioredoxin-related protein
MKSMQLFSRVVLAVCLIAVCVPLAAQDRIPWLTDLREARETAERQQRLVLLHFWSDSCAPCKRLERYVFNQPEFIRSLTTGYIPVKINVAERPDLAEFYQVTSWPTDVIVTPEGREVQRFESKQDSNNYIAMLDGIRARASVNGYIPVADNSGGTVTTSPYLRSGAPANGQSRRQVGPSIDQGTANPTIPNATNNPLDRSVPSQQQAIAPRYGNPYGQPAKDVTDRTSQWGQSQGLANSGSSQPTMNPYAVPNGQAANGHAANGHAQNSIAGGCAHCGSGPCTCPKPPQQPSHAGPGPGNWRPNHLAQNPQPQPRQPIPSAPRPQVTRQDPRPPQHQPNQPPAQPSVALDGFCPVTLVHQRGWLRGDSQWGAIHEGHIYLFAGPQEQKQFMDNPQLYAPLMAGYDPVRFAETGQKVPGKREFGLYIDEPGPIALFADEAALQRFHANSNHYFNVIRQAHAQRPGQIPRR